MKHLDLFIETLEAAIIRIEQKYDALKNRLDTLERYVFDDEPNILPDAEQPEGRGLEE